MSQFDELPKGWVETIFAEIFRSLQYGYTASASFDVSEPKFLRITDIKDDGVDWSQVPGCEISLEETKKYLINENDILFARTGSVEKAWRAKNLPVAVFASYLIRGNLVESEIAIWIEHFIRSYDYLDQIGVIGVGTGRKNVNAKNLSQVRIPLPPLNEQRRIVEKIEALTARSRKARAALDEIPALLDQFRQSVLAAAFRGDLTADWRAQNPDVEPAEALLERIRVDLDRRKSPKKVDSSKLFDIPETWSWVSLEAIATHKSGVAFKSKDFIQEGVQVIRLGNVYKGKLDLARDPVFLPPLCLEENFNLVPRCIVVSQTGTRFKKDYGNFVLIPENSPNLLLNQRLLAVYCYPLVDPKYVVFASKLEAYKNHFFASETGGVNQGNVGVSGVMEGPVPLAPVEEIKEVVQRIEDFFSAIDLLEELLIENQHELDQLDQSILAKAFRGELVPQDPNDEPAAILLDRIRAERERLGSGKKRGKAKG